MRPPAVRQDRPPLSAALCLLACAILCGCGDGGGDQPAPSAPVALPGPALQPAPVAEPAPAAPPAAASPEVLTPVWDASRALDSFSLTLTDESRGPEVVLRMTCRPDRSFTVESQWLTHIASEERLTIGVGGTVLALVATPMPDGTGVRATAPIDTGLLGDISVGLPISASYGDQGLGPLRAPARPLLARFVLACRNYAPLR